MVPKSKRNTKTVVEPATNAITVTAMGSENASATAVGTASSATVHLNANVDTVGISASSDIDIDVSESAEATTRKSPMRSVPTANTSNKNTVGRSVNKQPSSKGKTMQTIVEHGVDEDVLEVNQPSDYE